MAKLILLTVLTLLSVTSSAARDLSDWDAWRDACGLSRYTCKGLKPPLVRVSTFVMNEGAYGMYFGGRTVWLSPIVTGKLRYIVLVHEMVHYLQQYEDDIDVMTSSRMGARCMREEEAYEVSDQVARRLSMPELVRLDQLRAECA